MFYVPFEIYIADFMNCIQSQQCIVNKVVSLLYQTNKVWAKVQQAFPVRQDNEENMSICKHKQRLDLLRGDF